MVSEYIHDSHNNQLYILLTKTKRHAFKLIEYTKYLYQKKDCFHMVGGVGKYYNDNIDLTMGMKPPTPLRVDDFLDSNYF
jgi:hypothetical protein